MSNKLTLAEASGPLVQLMQSLSGNGWKTWLHALRQFNRKQNPWTDDKQPRFPIESSLYNVSADPDWLKGKVYGSDCCEFDVYTYVNSTALGAPEAKRGHYHLTVTMPLHMGNPRDVEGLRRRADDLCLDVMSPDLALAAAKAYIDREPMGDLYFPTVMKMRDGKYLWLRAARWSGKQSIRLQPMDGTQLLSPTTPLALIHTFENA